MGATFSQRGPAGPQGVPGADGVGELATATTVDTFELYKAVLFADGTVRAIPAAVEAPGLPTDFAVVAHLAFVRASWAAAAGASSYRVWRGTSVIATVSGLSYRDFTVEIGETYDYYVQAVNSHGMRSVGVGPEQAFIDPALNVAPAVEVRSWPVEYNDPGKTLLRLNATDPDGHALEDHLIEITSGVGTLTATDDPTVWELTIP